MRLYLVRHARPVVSHGVCYGSTDLTVESDHQQSVLMHLMSVLPARTPVFSSPLQRCHALAARLALALDSGKPVLDARLAEMNFGAWEMRTWDVIPLPEIDAWAADLANYHPGGGECLLDVASRVQSFREELWARKLDSAIVVAHAGTIRMMLAAEQCGSPEEMVFFAAHSCNSIAYGELITIDCQTVNE